jgi:hypothetical protein
MARKLSSAAAATSTPRTSDSARAPAACSGSTGAVAADTEATAAGAGSVRSGRRPPHHRGHRGRLRRRLGSSRPPTPLGGSSAEAGWAGSRGFVAGSATNPRERRLVGRDRLDGRASTAHGSSAVTGSSLDAREHGRGRLVGRDRFSGQVRFGGGFGDRFEARGRERAGEHGRELGRGGRTVRGVLGHGLADRIRDGSGDAAVAQVGHLDVADAVEHREDVGVPAVDERRLPGEHGVDRRAEGVDVPGRRRLAAGERLRWAVGPCDHVGARRVTGTDPSTSRATPKSASSGSSNSVSRTLAGLMSRWRIPC